jgi:chromosome segregation ATPase
MRHAAIAAALLALLPVTRLEAQSNRSLTDSDNRILLAQGTTITVPKPGAPEEENVQALQEQILLLRSAIRSLTESLAISNSEAETFKRQATDLTLKIEALGIPDTENDGGKLEQKLLAAVRDLRLLKKQQEATVNQLLRLTEAIQVVLKSTEEIDPQARLAVETELRKTNEILGTPHGAQTRGPVEATLNDGMVVDVKDDLALVVANIGERQGVQVGMPFQIWREDKRIGEVRVVDVRKSICGAVIQSLESEKEPVKTGDRLKVDARH